MNLEHLPIEGFWRIGDILAILPIGKSTLWLMVKEGRFPKPVKLGPKITAWRISDIKKYLEKFSEQKNESG
jgi:predicted DNA-binding transcriptional regulator AlpA